MAPRGSKIVTVNLDDTLAAANQALAGNQLPGTHLHDNGMESALATQYGIIAMPTIILVGKDGRVIDRSIQMGDLEDAIRKAL